MSFVKILLYFESQKLLEKSGIGRAFTHQKKALDSVHVAYTDQQSENNYDILHINTYGLNSYRMIRQAKQKNKKIIYHAHSTEEDFRNSFIGSNLLAPLYKKHLIKLYSAADQLITPTPYSKKIIENYGIQTPIKVLSNGVSLEKFEPCPAKEQQFREYFSLTPDQKVVISVGLYFERKGILDFVKVAEAFPEYTFIWFGYTPLYSVPTKVRKVVQGDHPDNVIFPGYIKGDILEGAYTNADLFFFPSYEETEGIVVLEALASHQHMLLRAIPVYNEWLTDKENCYMGATNEAFVSLIKKIMAKELPDLRESGYQTAVEKSIPEIGKRLKAIYEEVLER